MNSIDDILEAIFISFFVVTFLLNAGRVQKATEVCKECSIFLNDKVLNTEGELFNLLHIGIYQTIFRAYCLIPDHTKAQIYGRKLLAIYEVSYETKMISRCRPQTFAIFPTKILAYVFFFSWGNPSNALYVLELARDRALTDLMATQYSVENHISADPQSWIGTEKIME